MVNLFPIPWQDFSFFLSRYGVWLNLGWGWVSSPGYCIYYVVTGIDTRWNFNKRQIKYNSTAVQDASLYAAQNSGSSLGLLRLLVIK